jgi:hypothetical protein
MQMACPIGFAKGEQKYELCYAAIVNLPPRVRFHMESILLLEVTNSKAFKNYGAARVLCGVNSDGQQAELDNFAADMRRLQDGIIVDIPKANGGTRKIRLQAWVVGLSADFPAAGALLPFMESTSAHSWCRECDMNTEAKNAKEPFIFSERQQQQKRGRGDCGRCCSNPFHLRRTELLRAEITRLRKLRQGGKSVAALMQKVSDAVPMQSRKV